MSSLGIHHFILALTVMNPSQQVVGHEKVQVYGEDFVGCDMAATEWNNKNSWKPGSDGNVRVAECVPDNVLPLAYNGAPAQERGYAGPLPPVRNPYGSRIRSTIFVPGGDNIHVYSRTID